LDLVADHADILAEACAVGGRALVGVGRSVGFVAAVVVVDCYAGNAEKVTGRC